MIPKVIHYCWFGKNEKPKKMQKLISSWKNVLPDYEIKEWNEENFKIEEACDFVKQAYAAKKWAYIADYVRLFALYSEGGIYLDADVELLKTFDNYLNCDLFLSQESKDSLCTAVIGASKGNGFIKEFLDSYLNKSFSLEGKNKTIPNTLEIKTLAEKYFDKEITFNDYYNFGDSFIYPRTYFGAKDIHTYKLDISENTVAVHHLDASWYSPQRKFLKNCKKVVMKIVNCLKK